MDALALLPNSVTVAPDAADSPLTAAPNPQAGLLPLPEFFLKLFQGMLQAKVEDKAALPGKREDQPDDQQEGKPAEGSPHPAVAVAVLPPLVVDACNGMRLAAMPNSGCGAGEGADSAAPAAPAVISELGSLPQPVAWPADGGLPPAPEQPRIPLAAAVGLPGAIPRPSSPGELPKIPAQPLPLDQKIAGGNTGPFVTESPVESETAPSLVKASAPAPPVPDAKGPETSPVARVASFAMPALASDPDPVEAPVAPGPEAPEGRARPQALAFLARLTPLAAELVRQPVSAPTPALPAMPLSALETTPPSPPAVPIPASAAPLVLSGNPRPPSSPPPLSDPSQPLPAEPGKPAPSESLVNGEVEVIPKPNQAASPRGVPGNVPPAQAPIQPEHDPTSRPLRAGEETGALSPWVLTPVHRESGKSAPPQTAAPSAPVRWQTPAPPPAAREIRLQVSTQEQRVDVRLTERAGEVQVAVRTPDSRLAGVLREDLPALSARLEQTGFRAETWHPGLAPETRGLSVAETRMAEGSGHEPGGHGQPPPQQDRRQPQSQARGQTPPQEFSWLLSSLH